MSTWTFSDFFEAVHGVQPFQWQRALCEQVFSSGTWPSEISLPTAAGKTAVLDIAVYWMASLSVNHRRVVRRILHVVDRRLVVDSVYERSQRLAALLEDAYRLRDAGVLGHVARALMQLAGPDARRPLEVVRLRGGGFWEPNWVQSVTQPLIAVSTVDQVGSRLLFRGYGYARGLTNVLPVHAALAGCDTLIFVDEAHLSEPFLQTLEAIGEYRKWHQVDVSGPWHVVTLTATPRRTGWMPLQVMNDPNLAPRLTAQKQARLVQMDSEDEIAPAMARAVEDLFQEDPSVRVIAVIANWVSRARDVFELLRQRADVAAGDLEVVLLTGRSRPLDRDRILNRWLDRIEAGRKRREDAVRLVVVATQTIEVGANLDFDAMVTEIAALDALFQRLGRLDRLGCRGQSKVIIVAARSQLLKKSIDPVYGAALRETWDLLQHLAKGAGGRRKTGRSVNVGWNSLKQILGGRDLSKCLTQAADAPVLMPVHLDLLVQTSPLSAPDPDVARLLHGFQTQPPDVSVVWRADLDPSRPDTWPEVAELMPPDTAEALELPVWTVRGWLANIQVDVSDIEGGRETKVEANTDRPYLRWNGSSRRPDVMKDVSQIQPGDTIMVPAVYGGCDQFGWYPDCRDPVYDLAEESSRQDRIRLHPDLLKQWLGNQPDLLDEAQADLRDLAGAVEAEDQEQAIELEKKLLGLLAEHSTSEAVAELAGRLKSETNRRLRYPDGKGFVILGPLRRASGDAEDRSIAAGRTVLLCDHAKGVEGRVRQTARLLGLPDNVVNDLVLAARLHDLGKAYPRFQAWLYGGDLSAARAGPLLAKSGTDPRDRQALRREREEAGLPAGWRHEALSTYLAECNPHLLDGASDHDLVLHLIASHHGCARPFLPPVRDSDPVPVRFSWNGGEVEGSPDLSTSWIGGEVPNRFWRLVRRYGWWGLAYLEAILRMADWRESERSREGSP